MRRKNIIKKVFLLVFILIISCTEKPTDLFDDTLYISDFGHYVMNNFGYDYASPNPSFLEIKQDSVWINSWIEERPAVNLESMYILSKDSLETDELEYKIVKNNNLLKVTTLIPEYSAQYEFHYFKAKQTPLWTREQVLKTLTKQSYSAEIKKVQTPNRDLKIIRTLHFSEEILTTRYSYFYNEQHLLTEEFSEEYQLLERNGKFFFSYLQLEGNLQKTYQITNLTENSFNIYYFDKLEEITESYSPEKNNFSPIKSFKTCNTLRPIEYYNFNPDFKYVDGNDFVLKKVNENAPIGMQEDGYITIHFLVNCKGKLGQIGLEQMDFNFQSTAFNTALVHHLIDEVLKLDNWPETSDNPSEPSIHAFMMFKIENGKITDLCP